jgi:hypothetical protein
MNLLRMSQSEQITMGTVQLVTRKYMLEDGLFRVRDASWNDAGSGPWAGFVPHQPSMRARSRS